MFNKSLKWARVIIAIAFFVLTLFIFLGIKEILALLNTDKILYLQFVPSLIKFFVTLSISAIGFVFIIALTVLIGRFYCSAICPLGILQDFISRAGRFFSRKKKYKYSKPYSLLRNSILAITIITIVSGLLTLVNLLDPYSLFGKIATGIFRPVSLWINNFFTWILESMNVHSLSLVDQPPVKLTIIFPVLVILLLLYMAGKYGRLYCNTICPVGTLLGWISKISVFKIHIKTSSCTKCGKCSFECKSECISIKDLTVDHSRCVTCFNCLSVCKHDAISFGFTRQPKTPPLKTTGTDLGKRTFIATSLTGIIALTGMEKLMAADDKKPLNKKPTTIPVNKNSVSCPPGSLSIGHFTSACTACQLCVSQCPTGVLQPSSKQYGLAGFMQVYMDYDSQYCNFECVKCTEVCPTGAILPLTVEAKKTTQIGKVTFIKENCVVYTEDTACGSCSEHCPTQAVKMVPYKGSITIPEVDNTYCIGCGACEHACPVIPFKAIYVDGNLIHEISKIPLQKKLEAPVATEEFPF